jgi:hypothetical protein
MIVDITVQPTRECNASSEMGEHSYQEGRHAQYTEKRRDENRTVQAATCVL